VEKRVSEEYDEEAVALNLQNMKEAQPVSAGTASAQITPLATPAGGCPGSAMRQWGDRPQAVSGAQAVAASAPPVTGRPSQLTQWPVQLMLLPPTAPCFQNADLLIAADCVPFAFPDFHERFLKGKSLVIACPKLDDLQHYYDKLTQIFQGNKLNSVEVIKMEVPCCGGIAQAAIEARKRSGADVPLTVTTISVQGELLESFQV
jgi:hypothetical protein